MFLGTMVCPSFVLWMDLLTVVGLARVSTVAGCVTTTFISDEKLVCDCGNSVQDETMDNSVDVGLFVLAARWFAAFFFFLSLSLLVFAPLPRSVRVALPTLWS